MRPTMLAAIRVRLCGSHTKTVSTYARATSAIIEQDWPA